MRRCVVAMLAGVLLAGCGKGPTYQLMIGAKTRDLPVYDEPQRIQDDLVTNVKPLWDELKTGTSATFCFQRTVPWGTIEKDLKARVGGGTEVIATCTRSSGSWRFFKNRNGHCGLEELKDKGKFEDLFAVESPTANWSLVEQCLRTSALEAARVRLIAQGRESQE